MNNWTFSIYATLLNSCILLFLVYFNDFWPILNIIRTNYVKTMCPMCLCGLTFI